MQIKEKKSQQWQQILTILSRSGLAMTSVELSRELDEDGISLSERSIRLYLEDMQAAGLVAGEGRKGKHITQQGREEAGSHGLLQRVGSLASRIDALTFGMSFDLEQRRGNVVVNSCIMPRQVLDRHINDFCEVFDKGFAMGRLIGLVPEGKDCCGWPVPSGSVGLCTVCSITLSGILVKRGIPVRSIFGGLLQIENHVPTRFAELISYEGTSVDPLELFIKAGMADYLGALRSGNGRIGAGFREIPASSHTVVRTLADRVADIGLGAFLEIGKPERSVLNIPVRPGSAGFVAIGGLNPFSVFIEHGEQVIPRALCGLMEYNELFSYKELPRRLGQTL